MAERGRAEHGFLDVLRGADWDGLLERCHSGDPLQRTDVLAIVARDEGPAEPVIVTRDGRAVAGALLARDRHRGLRVVRSFGPTATRFDAGPHLVSPDVAEDLADALVGLPADILTLAEVAPDHPVVAAVARRVPARRRPEAPTYRMRLEPMPEHIGKRRREARRLLRRAARSGDPLRVDTLTRREDIAVALPVALTLHHRRWQGRAADPSVGTEAGRLQTTRIIDRLLADGRLRLATITRHGRPVAFALAALGADGRAIMYRTAHDRGLLDASGLGATAVVLCIDALAAEGVRVVDLGSGGDHFKAPFATPEPVITLQAALSPAGRGLLALSRFRATVPMNRGRMPPPRGEGSVLTFAGYDDPVNGRKLHEIRRPHVCRTPPSIGGLAS